ncbi:MAG: hypothetical protein CVV50_05735, partial [Spirochaetae bacterium HGW-Spirochaetae-6]
EASKGYIGLIMGLHSGVMVALTWLLRNKIDTLHKQRYILWAAWASILVYLAYFFWGNIYTIPFFRVLQGIIGTIGFSFGGALVLDIIPSDKKTGYIALFGLSGALTNSIAPYLSEFISGQFGFRYMFLAAVFFSLCWVFTISRVRLSPPPPHTSDSSDAGIKNYFYEFPIAVFFGAICSCFFSFISHYAEELKLFPVTLFFLVYSPTIMLLRFSFFSRLDRWNIHKLVLISFIFAFVGLAGAFLLSFYPSLLLVVGIGVLYGVAHGFLYPGINTLFVDKTPKRRGKATLIFILGYNLGYTLAAWIFGFIAESAGYGAMYLASALFCGLVCLTYLGNPRIISRLR